MFHVKNSSKVSARSLSLNAMALKKQREINGKNIKEKMEMEERKKSLALTIADFATAR